MTNRPGVFFFAEAEFENVRTGSTAMSLAPLLVLHDCLLLFSPIRLEGLEPRLPTLQMVT